MKKASVLRWVNLLLVLLFITQASSGIGHEALSHEVFEKVHGGGGLLFIVLGLIHLILNWGWVKTQLFKK